MLHVPPQQSMSARHTSPACVQKEETAQAPFKQNCEQQSVSSAHALPRGSFPPHVESGPHVLGAPSPGDEQVPLQHCWPVVQAAPFEAHAGGEHRFPMH
jgi:hypothetical protein